MLIVIEHVLQLDESENIFSSRVEHAFQFSVVFSEILSHAFITHFGLFRLLRLNQLEENLSRNQQIHNDLAIGISNAQIKHSLANTSHMTCIIQSELFISIQHSYTMLKFDNDIGSRLYSALLLLQLTLKRRLTDRPLHFCTPRSCFGTASQNDCLQRE